MKKILILLFVTSLLFLGCIKEEKNPSVKGRKVNNEVIEEYLYEWDTENTNKVIRVTKIYTYDDPSTKKFEEKNIDCENYKRKGSLYSCVVTQDHEKVVYKEIDSHDLNGTREDIIKLLKESGYQIVEE